MTVSRVLNGKASVAGDIRERVLEVARRLKYRPNAIVRAFQTGRTRSVGVMVSPWRSFAAAVIVGIHEHLAAHGYLPILHFPAHGNPTRADIREKERVLRLLDQRVDGIIFWPSDETVPDTFLEEVWERGLPLVAVDRHLARTRADFSGTDDVGGGRTAAEHLLALGHKRIAHLAGEPHIGTYEDRRHGFERTIATARGVDYEAIVCPGDDGYAAARHLLERPRPPTAVFAAADHMVLGIYRAARESGLVIGRDLSVVGFADLRDIAHVEPTLTTLRQDAEAIGRTAAELLLNRIEGRQTDETPCLVRRPAELIVRQSTGRPA